MVLLASASRSLRISAAASRVTAKAYENTLTGTHRRDPYVLGWSRNVLGSDRDIFRDMMSDDDPPPRGESANDAADAQRSISLAAQEPPILRPRSQRPVGLWREAPLGRACSGDKYSF